MLPDSSVTCGFPKEIPAGNRLPHHTEEVMTMRHENTSIQRKEAS